MYVPIFRSALMRLSIRYFHCIIRVNHFLFRPLLPLRLCGISKTAKAINADSLVFAHDQHIYLRAIGAIDTCTSCLCIIIFPRRCALDGAAIYQVVGSHIHPSAQPSLFNSGDDPDSRNPFAHAKSAPATFLCIFVQLKQIDFTANCVIYL